MISGIRVIRIKESIIAKNKGKSGFTTFSTLVLATLIPTNNTDPTGGVQSPIHKLTTIIIPNWTGSIPIDFTIGKKIGVKIKKLLT